MKTEKIDRKEAVLIATWVLILIFALLVPQCAGDNAGKAIEQFEKNKTEVERVIAD